MIESKFNLRAYLLILVCTLGIALAIFVLLDERFSAYSPLFQYGWPPLMILGLLYVIKDLKKIKVDTSDKTITIFSILYPSGKVVNLENYLFKLTTIEPSPKSKSVFLVDRQHEVSTKIKSLYYNNFDKLFEAILLPENSASLNGLTLMQLAFFGKAKLVLH